MTDEPINLDDHPEVIITARGGKLLPFSDTPEGRKRASEAGKKGAATKKAQALARRIENQALTQQLAELRDTYHRDDLGPTAAALAQELMRRTVTGQIPVRNGEELAKLLGQLVEIARLESGQATAHTAHVAASAQDLVEVLRREQAERG